MKIIVRLVVSALIMSILFQIPSSKVNGLDLISFKKTDTTSAIKITDEELETARYILKDKIYFSNDIEIFILYAFINYTGYKEENNSKGHSPTRKAVLKDIKELNIILNDNDYFDNKNISWTNYIVALSIMDTTPEFKYNSDIPSNLKSLESLPQALNEFCSKSDIEVIYKKYSPEYQKELDNLRISVIDSISKINKYLKIDNNDIKPFFININLLDSYDRGYGLGITYSYKNSEIIIVGLSNDYINTLIVHEYLHRIVTPLKSKLNIEVDSLNYLYENIPLNSESISYRNWASIVDESIIRGISSKATEEYSNGYVRKSMQNGFILSNYFYNNFDEFSSYTGTLEEFIKKLLQEYSA